MCRLLITFLLVHEEVLTEPILYLAIFFKRHRQEYYRTSGTRGPGLSQPAANALTNSMAEIGVLREITGKQSYRVFEFQRYMELFEERRERG